MPAIFGVVGAFLAGAFGASIAATSVLAITIGETVILTAASIGLGFIEKALIGKPKIPSLAGQQSQQITSRQAIAPWPVFYGRNRVGGTITYMSVTGTKGEFLNIVITLAGHQLHSIDEMFFDGVQVMDASGTITNATYTGFVVLQKNLGTASQTAFTLLTAADANWSTNCKQSGRAGVFVQLKFSADIFPNTIPNITFNIKGREVFDPRSSTTVYSENPALCVRDYLLGGDSGAKFGLQCTTGELNDASIISAANSCDDTIALHSGGTLSGGGNQRYLANGGFTTDQKPVDILNQLLSAMAGYLTWQNGKWSVYAGVWRAPTVTLTDDDLRGSVKIQMLASKSDLANRIKGAIINPTQAWQPADFAPYAEDVAHGFGSDQYLTQDNGERIDQTIQLPFTIDSPMAQRIAKIQLERIRRQIRATWPCKLTAYQLQPADVVNITRSRYGWTNKTFEVTQCILSLEPDSEGVAVPAVDLSLRESDATVYAWNPATEELPDPAPGTPALPNSSIVGAPSGLTLSAVTTTRADGILASKLHVAWTAPTDQMVLSGGKIAVLYSVHSSGVWKTADFVDPSVTQLDINAVSEGTAYDVEIYSLNTAGASSAVVQSLNFTIPGSASNYSYRPLSNPLTATDAGSNATISIAAFTMRVGGADKSINSGSITALTYGTLYYIYYTDATLSGGAVSYTATTTKENAISGSGQFFVGSILTPLSGYANTVGNNDGGVGAQNGKIFILSGSTYSTDDGVTWSPAISTNTIALAASDGNSSTSGGLASNGSSPGPVYRIGGFPAIGTNWSSIIVRAKLSTNMGANPSPTPKCILQASSDGFSTVTTIASSIGLGSNLALAVYSGTLSNNTNMGNFQVKIFMQGATGSVLLTLYELWVEAQL